MRILMESKLKISVVLTTYNGEKFIGKQLESIIKQSRKPDEIVIMDDNSSDNTVETVKILTQNTDIDCKLFVNDKNQGWRKNFISGFHYATGDLIFCADQDDIWYENKLEIMSKTIEENPAINVLACNLTPLYEEGATKLAAFYVNNYGDNYLECVELEKEGFTVLRPGCAICFRKEMLPWIYSVWSERLAHDEVIWAMGIVTKSLFIINEPLIHFRRHGNNNSPSNAKRIAPRLDRAECELIKINSIIEHGQMFNLTFQETSYLRKIKAFDEARIESLSIRSLKKGLSLLRYLSCYTSIKGWIADLVCIIRG